VVITAVFIDVTDADKGRVAMVEEGLKASEARGWPPIWNTDRARHSLSRMEDTMVFYLV
jgi:hypothetical protein